jgi:hypothetical protein
MALIALAVAAIIMFYVFDQQTPVSTANQAPVSGGILGSFGLTTLSPSDIAAVAQSAGFSGSDLITAVAVALAESGGNPNAYNAETAAGAPQGLGSYGLWQIYLNAHPEFAGDNLYDPAANANAAYSIYSASGGSFRAWSTFKNGAYQAFLDSAQSGVNV